MFLFSYYLAFHVCLQEQEDFFVNDVTFDSNANIIIYTSDGRFIYAVHDEDNPSCKNRQQEQLPLLKVCSSTSLSNHARDQRQGDDSPIRVVVTEAVNPSLGKSMKIPRLYLVPQFSMEDDMFEKQSISNDQQQENAKYIQVPTRFCTLVGIKAGFLAINRVARVVLSSGETSAQRDRVTYAASQSDADQSLSYTETQAGRQTSSSSKHDQVLVWTPKRSCLQEVNQEVVAVAAYPDSQKIACQFWDGSVYSLDISGLFDETLSTRFSHIQEEGHKDSSSQETPKLLSSLRPLPCNVSSCTSSSSRPLLLIPVRDASGQVVKFPQVCSTIQVSVMSFSGGCLNEFVFGLSSRSYSLFRNNSLILKGCCTSFLLHDNAFLVYTTTSHQMEWSHLLDVQNSSLSATTTTPSNCSPFTSSSPAIIPGKEGGDLLSMTGHAHMIQSSAFFSSFVGCRAIERGSKLIVSTPASGAVILQAIRGNLETVYPRTFLWTSLLSLIYEKNDYLAAFEVMKKHRMNFNILVDHNPENFLSRLETFIDQLSQTCMKNSGNGMKSTFGGMDNLVLFLTSLSNEIYSTESLVQEESKKIRDVTQQVSLSTTKTISSSWSNEATKTNQAKHSQACSSGNPQGKVFTVCSKMRDLMMNRMSKLSDIKNNSSNNIQEDKHRFLHPILLTLIKCGQVEEALVMIKNLKEQSLRSQAMSFLLYFIEVGDLFNHALGTYDSDIVLMVASKSSKDPKEYSKLLNDFDAIVPDSFRKYSIDMHLKRYEKALEHLSQCHGQMMAETEEERQEKEKSIFHESLNLIQNKRLFRHGIQVYSSSRNPEMCVEIWQRYADYLLSKKYYKEAAIAFEKAADCCQDSSSSSEGKESGFLTSWSQVDSNPCLEKAIKAHSLAGDWDQAVKVGLRLYSPHSVVDAGGSQTSGNKEKSLERESDHHRMTLQGEMKFRLLCLSLIQNLKSSGKFLEAGLISLSYLPGDQTEKLDKAIEISIEGHEWDQTVRLLQHKKQIESQRTTHNEATDVHDDQNVQPMMTTNQVDDVDQKKQKMKEHKQNEGMQSTSNRHSLSLQSLHESFVKALDQHAINLLSLISSQSESLLETHVRRLLDLRQMKKLQQEDQRRLSDDDFDDSSSQVSSQASSVASNYSSKSNSSGRLSLRTRASTTDSNMTSKKRDIKKWCKLKSGSRFEDVALVIAIKDSIVKVDSLKEEVSLVLRHLFSEGKVDEAEKLRFSFKSLLNAIQESDLLNKIWTADLKESFFLNDVDINPGFGKTIELLLFLMLFYKIRFLSCDVLLLVKRVRCVNICLA